MAQKLFYSLRIPPHIALTHRWCTCRATSTQNAYVFSHRSAWCIHFSIVTIYILVVTLFALCALWDCRLSYFIAAMYVVHGNKITGVTMMISWCKEKMKIKNISNEYKSNLNIMHSESKIPLNIYYLPLCYQSTPWWPPSHKTQ